MKFLIVDDSKVIRKAHMFALKEIGITDCVEAGDGIEAIVKMREHQFDFQCILLDINMPRLDGIATLQKIRSHNQFDGIPIVMITSESDHQRVMEAIRMGADGFLVKPMNPKEFVEKLRKILSKKNIVI